MLDVPEDTFDPVAGGWDAGIVKAYEEMGAVAACPTDEVIDERCRGGSQAGAWRGGREVLEECFESRMGLGG